MKKWMPAFFIVCFCLLPAALSCVKKEAGQDSDKTIKVVTTLYPLYDFAGNVGGKLARVELLLPPGMEPHSFEPKPADIRKINDADILVYTGKFMEPWVGDVLGGVANRNLLVVDTSAGVLLDDDHDLEERHGPVKHAEGRSGHRHVHPGKDPHIWLDFSNAVTMVENILNAYISRDPANRQVYIKNADAYTRELSSLDRKFRDALSSCRKDVIVHGGHFAFGYLAKRYNLRYLSAYPGFSPDAEPVPGDIIVLMQNLRKHNLRAVFFEELVSPNVAETIARETGAQLLMLHGAHNISKDEWDRKVTFVSLMENNLRSLVTGLECQ